MDKPPTKAKPRAVKVPLSDIGQLPEIFQPRDFDADGYKAAASKARSEEHIQDLVKVLRDGRPLDPLEVAPMEGLDFGHIVLVTKYVVIDGHHRLAAYREVAKKNEGKRIPCLILEGFSPAQLMLRATKQNAKAKLNMTEAQRMQNAWRTYIACYRELKPIPDRPLGVLLNVSKTTAGRIKKELEDLLKREPDMKGALNVPEAGAPSWRETYQRRWLVDGGGRTYAQMEKQHRVARIDFEAKLLSVFKNRNSRSLPDYMREEAIIFALRVGLGIEVSEGAFTKPGERQAVRASDRVRVEEPWEPSTDF